MKRIHGLSYPTTLDNTTLCVQKPLACAARNGSIRFELMRNENIGPSLRRALQSIEEIVDKCHAAHVYSESCGVFSFDWVQICFDLFFRYIGAQREREREVYLCVCVFVRVGSVARLLCIVPPVRSSFLGRCHCREWSSCASSFDSAMFVLHVSN